MNSIIAYVVGNEEWLMLGRFHAKYCSFHCKSAFNSYLVDNTAFRCIASYADKIVF